VLVFGATILLVSQLTHQFGDRPFAHKKAAADLSCNPNSNDLPGVKKILTFQLRTDVRT